MLVATILAQVGERACCEGTDRKAECFYRKHEEDMITFHTCDMQRLAISPKEASILHLAFPAKNHATLQLLQAARCCK